MNWEIFSVILTGFSVYIALRSQISDFKNEIRATNQRLDATWSELLAITRQFKTTEKREG